MKYSGKYIDCTRHKPMQKSHTFLRYGIFLLNTENKFKGNILFIKPVFFIEGRTAGI